MVLTKHHKIELFLQYNHLLYKMKKYIFLMVVVCFALANKNLAQTEEYSYVYLYYTNSFGHRPIFTILFNDKEAFQLEKKERIKCKMYSTGNIKISCFYISHNNRRDNGFITINVQHGKNYYVKFDNNNLNLKALDEISGEKEFNESNLDEIRYFTEDLQNPSIKKKMRQLYSTNKERGSKIRCGY